MINFIEVFNKLFFCLLLTFLNKLFNLNFLTILNLVLFKLKIYPGEF